MSPFRVVDAHVHFWDPAVLRYPWLDGVEGLRRPFLPADHAAAAAGAPVDRLVFVEANPAPADGVAEARWAASLAAEDPRIAAVVAFVDLLDPPSRDAALDELAALPLVRGVRHNIQGNPAGFCLQREFVRGVREAGRRGLTFDLCATHDQLSEVLELAGLCPETELVLDHCGKPPIRAGLLDPWRDHVTRLSRLDHVWCKLSGLMTEADPAGRTEAHLLPYAEHVVASFGTERVMYGSDWPVLTLAGSYTGWYDFTRRLTARWSVDERHAFFHQNAERFYRL